MAEVKTSTGGGSGDLKWFLTILFLLIFMWFSTGGHKKVDPQKGFFSNSPTTLDKNIDSKKNPTAPSRKTVSIVETINARGKNVDDEYIAVQASPENNNAILFTGWSVGSSALGRRLPISKGSNLPFQGAINFQEDIYLNPGDIAYISSGRSPIGTSFRVNKCFGYLTQFQNFQPSIPKKCPNIYNDFLKNNPGRMYDERCFNYMRSLRACEIPLRISNNVDQQCAEYVKTKINYNSCVANHKDDPDFYKNEWRIFLGENTEIWRKNRDVIKIFDQEDQLIDSVVSYFY